MLNHSTIMGRLTKDPELRYTQNQIPVATFSIACERDYQAGGSDREVDFISCTAWRTTAEFVNRNFRKGMMAVVAGRLQSRKWEDRNGTTRTEWFIEVQNMYFGEPKRVGDANVTPPSRETTPQIYGEIDDGDGELPF